MGVISPPSLEQTVLNLGILQKVSAINRRISVRRRKNRTPRTSKSAHSGKSYQWNELRGLALIWDAHHQIPTRAKL